MEQRENGRKGGKAHLIHVVDSLRWKAPMRALLCRQRWPLGVAWHDGISARISQRLPLGTEVPKKPVHQWQPLADALDLGVGLRQDAKLVPLHEAPLPTV